MPSPLLPLDCSVRLRTIPPLREATIGAPPSLFGLFCCLGWSLFSHQVTENPTLAPQFAKRVSALKDKVHFNSVLFSCHVRKVRRALGGAQGTTGLPSLWSPHGTRHRAKSGQEPIPPTPLGALGISGLGRNHTFCSAPWEPCGAQHLHPLIIPRVLRWKPDI